MLGDQGHAEASHDGLLDRLVRGQFHRDVHRQSHGGELLLGMDPRPGTRLPDEERLLGDARERDPRRRDQRMVRGGHDYVGMIAYHLLHYLEPARGPAHHSHIDVVILELADDLLPVADRHRDCDARVCPAEGGDGLRREVLRCADGPQAHVPAVGLAERREGLRAGLDLSIDPMGRGHQHLTSLRGALSVRPAFEQLEADEFLQQAQLLGDRRGGHVHDGGCTR